VFEHIDIWNQNVEFMEQSAPFNCPAVFVEFHPVNWNQEGSGQQSGTLKTTLHIVTEYLTNTEEGNALQGSSLDYLDYPNHVLDALHNFETGETSAWNRVGSIPNHNHERFLDSREVYECEITTRASENLRTIPRPALDLGSEFE